MHSAGKNLEIQIKLDNLKKDLEILTFYDENKNLYPLNKFEEILKNNLNIDQLSWHRIVLKH